MGSRYRCCGSCFCWRESDSSGGRASDGMRLMVDNLRKHLRLVGRLWKISVQKSLAFRWQFIGDLLDESLAVAFSLLMFDIAYDYASVIGGWDQKRTILLVGIFQTYSVLLAVFLRPNLNMMSNTIHGGDLDGLLLRPGSTQVLLSLRQIQITGLVKILPGFAVIIYALSALGHTPALLDVILAVVLLVAGLGIVYGLWFASMTLEFWFAGLWSLVDMVPSIFSFGQYPSGIYKGATRVLFLTVVPVIVIANFPAEVLLGDLSTWKVGYPMGLALLTIGLSRLAWRQGLRRYASAGS
ncbi:MAG: hypothetical protein GKR89_28765 [Candidatus Latescibacteria bacterium]|nr:hypothetical protein [Candidatus Latescibacterota bacterium]